MTSTRKPARSEPDVRPGRRRVGPARGAGLLVLAAALGLASAAPAAAHSTKVLIKVTATPPANGSGPTQVVAVATYATDRHKASGLTVKASAAQGGRRVAATLKPKGQGVYAGSLRLGPGRWRVTATAAGEAKGSGTADVTVAAPAPTTTAAPTTTPPPATTADPPASAAAAGETSSGLPIIGLVAVVVAVGAAAAVLVRRRSRPRAGD